MEEEGAGIFAGQVLVALSWPLLSPHPLPFRCRERGVAAFAGEMADGEGAGRPSLAKSGGCEKLFLLKNPKFRKAPISVVRAVQLHFQFSTAIYIAFRLSFGQARSIYHRGGNTAEDIRRKRNSLDI